MESTVVERYVVTQEVPRGVFADRGLARWNERRRDYLIHRETAWGAIRGHRPLASPPWTGPVRVSVRWVAPMRNRIPDRETAIAWLGPTITGVREAGLIINPDQVVWGDVRFAVDFVNYRIEVTFSRASEQAEQPVDGLDREAVPS